MSLEHILLGLLREPATGYDLKNAFSENVRHFWSAELSQIYPTLKRLEQRRMLRSRVEPSPKGPNRRVYTLTGEGRTELLQLAASRPGGRHGTVRVPRPALLHGRGRRPPRDPRVHGRPPRPLRPLARSTAGGRTGGHRHVRRRARAVQRCWFPPVRGAADGHSFHRGEGDLVQRDAGRDRSASDVQRRGAGGAAHGGPRDHREHSA